MAEGSDNCNAIDVTHVGLVGLPESLKTNERIDGAQINSGAVAHKGEVFTKGRNVAWKSVQGCDALAPVLAEGGKLSLQPLITVVVALGKKLFLCGE